MEYMSRVEEFTLEFDALVFTVNKILRYFAEQWEIMTNKKYNHIDVTVSKTEGNYAVLISNYGQYKFDLKNFSKLVFQHLVGTNPTTQNIPLAVVRKKGSDGEVTYLFHLAQKYVKSQIHEDSIPPPKPTVWREYLSVELKHKVSSKRIEQFKDIISRDLMSLGGKKTNVKYTLHCDRTLIYANHVDLDDDVKSCEIFINALVNVIQQSSNTDFRNSSFELMNIRHSEQAKKVLMAKMLPMINDNYIFPNVNYHPDRVNSKSEFTASNH